VGVSATGVINRNDFGLRWQQRLAAGGVLVGDEVKRVLDGSAVREAE
jgi:polyisoprenoid-binding protein YceI